jgi:hypothetical protein
MKLDLAILNKKQDELNTKEMNGVRAGRIDCECEVECNPVLNTYVDVWAGVDAGVNCTCGSVWTVFGLIIAS